VSTLPQKITFAQMRSSGVRGLLVYCRNYKCSHLRAIRGRMTGGYRTLNPGLSALPAASAVPMSGQTSTGK
jgi:hypothetical protein